MRQKSTFKMASVGLPLSSPNIYHPEKMTLLPQQNVWFIWPQQTRNVVVTIVLATATALIVLETIPFVVTIPIVTSSILVC